ncbi:hypothetical protein U9M48_021844 [Paspalum notatum var. saurae]|uniref:Uncharacterized protein n=2 Tax=Paspalum notatum var. saurae TaxID=547442 RepID=A0AAQ3TH56_PASNO
MRKQKEGAAMAAPLPHGCPLSSLHSPHHRNMKTECSYHKEDDPLLRSSIHALKDAMEVASLLLPLLSMGVETMESTPDDPRRRGKAAALWDRVRSGITALMSPMSPLPPPNPRHSNARVIALAMPVVSAIKTAMQHSLTLAFYIDLEGLWVTPLAKLFALRLDVCEQQQEYFEEGKYNMDTTQ